MSMTQLTVGDVMQPQPHWVDAYQSLHAAKTKMVKEKIRHLPVLREGVPIGILSERDIRLAYAIPLPNVDDLPVGDVCVDQPYVADPDEPLQRVALEMAEHRYGCTLVVRGDKLLGIFTTVDACRAVARILGEGGTG